MSLNELAHKQKEIGEKIKSIASNYKKDSVTRKTLQYLQQRLQNLDELWNEFENIDSDIRINYGNELDHPYFVNAFYDAVQQGYADTREDIITRIAAATTQKTSKTVENQPLTTSNVTGNIPKSSIQMPRTIKADLGVISKQRSILKILHKTVQNSVETNPFQSEQAYMIKIKNIQRYLEEAQRLHEVIWQQIDDVPTSGYDLEEYFSLEEQAQNALIKLHEGLSEHTRNQLNNSTSQPSQNNTPSVNLPKIALPKFDGDYLRWKQFCDLFTEVVHNQPIAKCQKMWYLKTSLAGEAEKLVRHLTTSDMNYDAAWKIVKERYENTRLLTNALLSNLLSQQTINTPTASSIKQLHDTTQECLLGLQNMGIDTTSWDPILVHILIRKLDKMTHTLYEQSLTQPRQLQPLKEFLTFLETRFQSLEALGSKARSSEDQVKHFTTSKSLISGVTAGTTCTLCNGKHPLFACHKFLQLTPHKRLEHAKGAKLCVNCLKVGHNSSKCPSRACTRCSKRHNTLLHLESTSNQSTASITPQPNTQPLHPTGRAPASGTVLPIANQIEGHSTSLTTNIPQPNGGYVLLSTVLVNLSGENGSTIECRAILDSGSQLNFVTEKIVRRLRLAEVADHISIEGIGQQKHRIQRRVNLKLQSRTNGFFVRIEAHVLPRIISAQPTQPIDATSWAIPNNIVLADPDFNHPDAIDLLIGAELYHSLLAVGQIKLGNDLPTMQNTVLGWTIAGRIGRRAQVEAVCGICSEDEALEVQIEKFWRLEDAEGLDSNLTRAERQCETHFTQTVKRDPHGRFTVSLPFRTSPSTLGTSRDLAYQRFMTLERRLSRDAELKRQYVQFMEEYVKLGHMEEVDLNSLKKPYYFLPHHCVLKPESSTTKLRVVFDASAKTSSNLSLNDVLHTGPVIQDEMFSILLRFRMPRYIFTADIEKMYRQVNVEQSDRKYQLIWWRSDVSQQIKCFQLNTITYGTTCAPFLAIKCLHRLADDYADEYPLGAKVLKHDFYVDDVLTGADSLTTAIETQQQLRSLLQIAGFKLRKWCANHPRLMQDIPQNDREVQLNFENKIEEHIKTVGLIWLPKTDDFSIKASWIEGRRITKRTAYSDIAHLYDPLGIMAPVVVIAKIFLQKLWSLKLDWDAALPQELHTSWAKFREGLKTLNDIKFPRHVYSHRTPKFTQIHIFADASEKAYGAAAYVRAISKDGIITVRLLCAKSRVAPTTQTTLPRLELCAAKLAAELARRINVDLRIKNENIYLWSDSEIVLAWINSTSSSFHTFVANRVARIQELTAHTQWRHVSSKENPADIVSRGLAPEKLKESTLWFYGPMFLHGVETIWPVPYENDHTDYTVEHKRIALPAVLPQRQENLITSINHKNSFKKLQRIVAYILRFVNHLRNKNRAMSTSVILSTEELEKAHTVIIKTMQQQHCTEDITSLTRYGEVSKTSSLSSLTPFLDDSGIVRVGGRLQASNLSYDAKHPMILPYSHEVTKLIINDIHLRNHHVGPQTLLAMTRQKYWPIKGKTITRSVVQHCTLCTRANPKMLSQLMGNLPADRVQPSRPFVTSGVDFCGPIYTHFKLRGKRPQKSYIAVFCCFATKATHLELVTDLTTQGFIGALKRFMGRRGHCRKIYCDNATNFVGAKNELQELRSMIESEETNGKIATACSASGTDFQLIPPRAPHFGGLWEAAVKSAKHLLKKTLASASLTYEELETAVIEIEAILNSRPITPMSANPNDMTALTPGHLLIGEPLTSTIDTRAHPQHISLLTRWKLVSHIKNEFWRRWTSEYLNQLQQRHKWKQSCINVKPDTMVIVKEEGAPPLKWSLGRIVKTHTGPDNLVRVADVRTMHGIKRRAIHNLAPLPMIEEPEDNPTNTGETQLLEPAHHEATATRHSTDRNKNSDEAEVLPRKKQRNSLGSAVVTLLLACLILPTIHSSPVEIRPFTTQPGIYFENLGATNIISSEWNLIAYYDMQPFWREFEALRNASQILESLCQQITERHSCEKIVAHFQHLTRELTANNELLLPTVNATRIRRGAINFVGNIANALFGVLDSEYAEKMSATINDLRQNENHLAHLIKNQTSLIDATINIIRRDQDAINKQFKDWETHINKITAGINGINQELHQEKLSNLFTSLAMHAMLTASNFHRIQLTILDVLADTHNGKISPQLITPDQLKRELTVIRGHLSSSLRLPVAQDNVLQFYNLMTIQGRATKGHVIFKLNLPLCTVEDFELFSVVPVPTKINNTFLAIQPTFPYLVVNLHRDQYYPLSQHNLQSCATIIGDRHLCKQNHPIYRKGASLSACEMNLINHLPPTPTCKIVHVGDGPHWIQLHNPNQWIYAMSRMTTINVVCNDNVTQIDIQGSGVLTLKSECIINQPLITIRGHNTFPTNTRMSYVPATNLTEWIDLPQPAPEIQQLQGIQLNRPELEDIRRRLQLLQSEEVPTIRPHDVHQLAVGYTGLLVALTTMATIAFIWIYRHKIWQQFSTRPIPRPRQHASRSRGEPVNQQEPSHQDFTIAFEG